MRTNKSDDGSAMVRTLARRSWLSGVWGNPMARAVDRWQAAVRMVLIFLSVVMIPVAATWAFRLTADNLNDADLQSHDRTEVTALLTADAPPLTYTAGGVPMLTSTPVAARWLATDGTVRTGAVASPAGSRSGARLPIWLNRSGEPVDPPLTSPAAVGGGLLLGIGALLAWGLLLAVVSWLTNLVLNRGRRREWDRAWSRVAPLWMPQQ